MFSNSDLKKAIFYQKNSSLKGTTLVPGDKSISQRSLIFSLIGIGSAKIINILESEDVLHTLKAIKLLGATVSKKNNQIIIKGIGLGNLKSPNKPIYMGNSGTGVRLLIGLVAGSNATVTFYGDNSLSNRPMDRIIKPLKKMGAKFITNHDNKLPITVIGAMVKGFPTPIDYTLPVASAQVKSALILASLTARGISKIKEKSKSRNSTEVMLANCGAKIKFSNKIDIIKIEGASFLNSVDVNVPGDPSSAAFIAVAALITKNSKVIMKKIFYDKFRLTIFEILKKMGAKIEIIPDKNKETCTIKVASSRLKNIKIKSNFNTALIDEFPILSVAAVFASGKMTLSNLEELRFKESDRLKAIYENLVKCGAEVNSKKNNLEILGDKIIEGGCEINSCLDHRIAMAFNILSLISKQPIKVIGNDIIKTSFPNFFGTFKKLGVTVKKI